MAKERMLTVLVPITDSDATAVAELPAIDSNNVNVIYKHGGAYKRLWLNQSTNQYEYHDVVDREFPYLGRPLEIFDFTYDATRMGTAPTISAQGVMWYADKDEDGNDVTLEKLWITRCIDCHVSFNGENFYLKQVPTSSKSNEDARYRYDIDFVSERVVLERVYLYDVVQPFVTEKPISESTQFSFFGDINELAKRINASLLRSGLAKITYRQGVTEGSFFTYEEWNAIHLGTYDGPISTASPDNLHKNIWSYYGGNYSLYLQSEVYLIVDGEYSITGYQCRIGNDKKGVLAASDEKLITFDNNTIHEALQQFYDTFELQYYIYKETDESGASTGNTIIEVADCQYDFADRNPDDTDYLRDSDGIPTSSHPFDYGRTEALLSKEKTNTTDKIVTRITGVGSDENIPWYYPNPTADGWIKPMYKTNGVEQDVVVNYPTSEGVTTEESVMYEKYLKNRIGDVFQYGRLSSSLRRFDFADGYGDFSTHIDETDACLCYDFTVIEQTRLKISSFRCTFEGASVQCHIYKENGDSLPNETCSKFLSGGTATLDAGTYHLVFEITFTSGGPTATNSINRYFYPSKNVSCGFTDTWSWRFLILALSAIGAPAVIYSYISDLFGGGFDSSLPGFFSNNPNLKYLPSADASKMGWYDGERRISPDEMEFGEGNTDYYAFEGGDGAKAVGVDDIYKVSFTDKNVSSYNLQLLGYNWHNAYDTYNFVMDMVNGNKASKSTPSSVEEVDVDVDTFVMKYVDFSVSFFIADGWYKESKKQDLADFGISVPTTVSPDVSDTIEFKRMKYVTPQPNLMPEAYVKTDGERRSYNAVNYPLGSGTPDAMIGEETDNGQIINPIYYKEDTTTHYDFENEYIHILPHEHIENFDDVKPTIEGQTNVIDGGQAFRIDVVEEFAYDELDNDEIWESNDDGNVSGEYKHPYFFAKLRPLGFNIFDLALQEDMVLSMTTGHCGACNFKIAVDENTQKNPVQIWEYDVYEGSTITQSALRYHAGDLRRHGIDTTNLYYDINGVAAQVDVRSIIRTGFIVGENFTPTRGLMFQDRLYDAGQVINGEVGSLKLNGKTHFEGDVLTSGRFIKSQQDTSGNYVWVALTKDIDTYGVLMPSARPDYGDHTFDVYIRPKSIADVHTSTSTASEDEGNADKFVLTNIRLPQVYLRRAEKELSRKLVGYMYDNNYQKFNFSIKFSRIFLAENATVDEKLNENSVLYVTFNNKTYRQYVKHYTYRMTKDVVLPEIGVDMNEELSVTRTATERQSALQQQTTAINHRSILRQIAASEARIGRRTIGRNEDTIISGNLVSRDAATSFSELKRVSDASVSSISDTRIDLEVNHFKKADFFIGEKKLMIGDKISVPSKSVFDSFVSSVNTFNEGSAKRLNQIRETIEHRLPIAAGGSIEDGCNEYKYNHDELSHTTELLWYNADGTVETINDTVCSTSTNMTNITWKYFSVE